MQGTKKHTGKQYFSFHIVNWKPIFSECQFSTKERSTSGWVKPTMETVPANFYLVILEIIWPICKCPESVSKLTLTNVWPFRETIRHVRHRQQLFTYN